MASTYSTLLGQELVANNEQAGVWGNSTNLNFGKIIEQAIAGATVLNITSAGGTYTLNDVNGTPDQRRSAILRFTGTPSVTTTIIVPTKSKVYTVRNDSNAAIRLKTSAQVDYVQLGANEATIMFCNGSSVKPGLYQIVPTYKPVSAGGTGVGTFTAGFLKSPGGTANLITETTVGLDTFEVGGTLTADRGGTGVGSYTAGGAIVGNGTSATLVAVGSVVGDYLTWNGTTWVGSTSSLGGVTSFNGRTGAITPQSTDYSAYYVAKTGTNASGTWAINISGSTPNPVATATNALSITGPTSNGYGTRTVATTNPVTIITGNIWYKTA